MARTIESPGIQISEFDLSLNATLPVGTNIFVQGFAPQGPTDELLNVTSISEFEQIYGTPTNAAERYFYHTAKQVFASPGNLLCTRLPYGLSGGEGYGNEYSALLYPVTATGVATEASTTTTQSVCGAGILSATIVQKITVSTLTGTMTYDTASTYAFGAPILISLTEEEYMTWEAGAISWANTSTSISTATTTVSAASGIVDAVVNSGSIANSVSGYGNAGNAGIILINKIKSANDQIHQGIYVALRDNTNFDDIDANGHLVYDSINSVNYDNSGAWAQVPTSTIEKSLTGLDIGDSMSEDLDVTAPPSFDTADYTDVILLQLARLQSTSFTSSPGVALQPAPIENYYGSLDAARQYTPKSSVVSMFVGTIVNEGSDRIQMKLNPNISTKGNWNANNTRKVVTVDSNMYAIGPTLASTGSNKYIGNVPLKLERSLRLAENRDQIPVDLVCEAGLGTIWTAGGTNNVTGASLGNGATEYNDETFLNGVIIPDPTSVFDSGNYLGDQTSGTSSIIAQQYNTIYNTFVQFAGETRKDCLFIADALKHIFVQDQLTTLANKANNFSQHIYWPLKNLFASANSNYSCTYGNWVSVYDNVLGKYTWLPFSGFEANIMAKMDSALQPWFAPAGLNNGIVRGITDIAINPTQKQRDLLYRISVNPVVLFPGDGYTVWGQKTLQKKPSAFDRINVRRLFLVMEKATNAIMRYFVFEPNTVFTRTRVVNVLTPIFEIPKNNEGVYDYLIVCDERNNTPTVIDANELVVDIYMKPVRTAEFILVNFYATRTDQNFSELI